LITNDTIDRIMNTARIEEVVGDFVTLKRRGVNLLGLCPFHNEKTPSFTVSPAKGIYKCFGCGKAGNSINFIMDHEQLSYPEALRYLAGKYHIEIEETVQKKEEIEQKTERESLFILMTAAQKYYSEKLVESEDGRTIAMPYLKERELKPNIIESFGLGWSGLGREDFSKWAIENGYSKEYLLKTGMAFETDSGVVLDRFHERIMFPIHNIAGKVAGFGGRILKNNAKEAKYINSPETDIYNKSKILYGLFQAKKTIQKEDSCIVVEGYMDVLAMHQAGINNVVASSGTSLTDEHLNQIQRLTYNIIYLFDGDNAGKKASVRALDKLKENSLMVSVGNAGINIKVLILPSEHDPDSFVKTFDIDYVKRYIKEKSQDFIPFNISLLSQEVLNDPIKKSTAAREMLDFVIAVKGNVERSLYIRQIAKGLDIDEKLLNDEIKRMTIATLRKENNTLKLKGEPEIISEDDFRFDLPISETRQEKQLIKVLLLYGNRIYTDDMTCSQYIYRAVSEMDWEDQNCHNIFSKYKDYTEKENKAVDVNVLLQDQPSEIRELAYGIITDRHQLSPGWEKFLGRTIIGPDYNYKDEIKSAIGYLKLVKINKMLTENLKGLPELETDEAMDDLFMIHNELLKLKKQLVVELGIAPPSKVGLDAATQN